MKRSELKKLIREVIEEEFARSPANQLDNIFAKAEPSELSDKNFLISTISRVLKTAQFLDSRTVSDIRKLLAWRNIDTSALNIALQNLKT